MARSAEGNARKGTGAAVPPPTTPGTAANPTGAAVPPTPTPGTAANPTGAGSQELEDVSVHYKGLSCSNLILSNDSFPGSSFVGRGTEI